ncbi:hypothetical protein PV08_08628 [Exophiala spinifera]|uniref:C2H2-type domain-containing protein n=1 Tax=Exophiala spinifera TaxID=91928 RepID=A0A0D2B433_9EURO|nr:uncharacterized protein PV08_08628 [Exophiala spinifera]KIW13440.1 hypothetical protein PV08_08628 [Exophiala spinifera]
MSASVTKSSDQKTRAPSIQWTREEDQTLKQMRDAGYSWSEIAKAFPARSAAGIRTRWTKNRLWAQIAEAHVIRFLLNSGTLREAIREYEDNVRKDKWKVIGQRAGIPEKSCEIYATYHFSGDLWMPAQKLEITREKGYTEETHETNNHKTGLEPVENRLAFPMGKNQSNDDDGAERNIESDALNESSMRIQKAFSRPLSIERSISSSRRDEEISCSTTSTSLVRHGSQSDSESSSVQTNLASKIVLRTVAFSNSQRLKTLASSPRETSGSASDSRSRDVPTTRRSKSTKRSLQDFNEDDHANEDEDEDEDRVPCAKRKRGSLDAPIRLFACPYAKFDPERYSERNNDEKNYRKCSSKYLRDIGRVKQHLCRTHMRPQWYCPNCYKSFGLREHFNEHIMARPRCDRSAIRYEEMMTDDQFKELKRRNRGNSQYEAWYKIFQLLFPNSQRPISPYVLTCDQGMVKHFVSLFQVIGPQETFQKIQDSRACGPGSVQLDISTQAIVDEAFEIAMPDHLEQLEGNRRVQYEQITMAEPSRQQLQDRQLASSLTLEHDGRTVVAQAVSDHPFQVPQTGQPSSYAVLQPGWMIQQVPEPSHSLDEFGLDTPSDLPIEITDLFHPYGMLFGSSDTDAGD